MNSPRRPPPPPLPPGARRGKLPPHYLHECFDNADKHRLHERCAWPSCGKPMARGEYGEEVPLCIGHVYETWRLARDLAERTENRDKTITVYDAKTLETRKIERPVAQLGWIYYLLIGGSIKVGYASNLDNRMRAYPPTTEFLFAHPGNRNTEKSTHSMLYLWRVAGREWYDDCPEVRDYIDKMKARYIDRFHPPGSYFGLQKPLEKSGHTIQLRRRSGGTFKRSA